MWVQPPCFAVQMMCSEELYHGRQLVHCKQRSHLVEVFAWNCPGSDRPRPKKPLMRLRRAQPFLSARNALESTYNQAQEHSTVSVRLKCAWIHLWSDSSALDCFCALEMHSNPPIIRLKRTRQFLCAWNELESTYGQTQAHSTASVRLKCAQIHLWSDSSALDCFCALELRSNLPMVRLKRTRQFLCAWNALESTYDQTQAHSLASLRLKCAWIHL